MKKHSGFLAIVAVVIIIIFGFIGVIAAHLVNVDAFNTANDLSGEQALYLAESGIDAAQHALLNTAFASRIGCSAVTGNAILTNNTFSGAKGPFTVTGAGPQSPSTASTLNGPLTASATTIPLVSAANYATSGRIMVDKELINYLGKSGNNLLNAQRGADGSVAATHVTGVPVGQYQCSLSSVGSVPSVNPNGNTVGGQRTVQAVMSLPEGWAVGTATGTTARLIHWNKPTEEAWNDASVGSLNRDFNAVFMLSNADAWAVGQSGEILHWTGNAWSAVASNTNRALNSIYCIASNNCWAVGASRTIDFWNGSAWTVQTTTALPNVAYNSVFCNTTNNCWIVANTSGGEVYLFWDGSTWTRDASRPTPANNLNAVVCAATSDCWAVGAARSFSHWDGSSWSTVSVSSLPNVAYNGVDCVSSSDCWAVGNNSGGSVTVHWDGISWTRNTSPTTSVNLLQVKCHASDDCWAVGASSTVLHWDGSAWSDITNPLANTVTLNSVFVIGPNQKPTSAWQEAFP